MKRIDDIETCSDFKAWMARIFGRKHVKQNAHIWVVYYTFRGEEYVWDAGRVGVHPVP